MTFWKTTAAALVVLAACAARGEAPTLSADNVKPLPHYGHVARRVASMLPTYHILQQPFGDEMSRKAWTNMVTQFDWSRAVFLQSDLDEWEPMQTKIDDALRAGDVSWGYEVYRVFVKRLSERLDFVTNLLARGEFEFEKPEDYVFRREKSDWPKDKAAADELWRKRIKNEMLSIILNRKLDKEDELAGKGKPGKNKKKSGKDAAGEKSGGDSTNAVDKVDEPEKTPRKILEDKYRHYLQMVLTETDEETVLQRYLLAATMAYDPHSAYMSPMRKEDFDMEMNLSLCGVGAVLSQSMEDGSLEIKEVMKGGPVAREGSIKPGNKIVGVGQGDGPVEDITWKPMRKSIKKIRGPKNTKVVLEITDKNGDSRRRVPLIRDEIKLEEQAATGRVEKVVLDGVTNSMGYVRLPGFYGTMDKKPGDPGYRSCSLDVAKLIARFNSEGSAGLVLDLRGNGGGSLKEAVLLTALFVHDNPGPCPVVQIREARNLYVLPTFPDTPTFAWRRPMVVIIDRFSASASEIVAGALQDTGRAVIVGDTRSHGKGTVQTVMPMGGRSDTPYGSMKITTARFYRINGSSTQVKGVESDIRLPSSMDERVDIGEDNLPNALPWSAIEPAACNPVWNMQTLVPALRRLSEARTGASREFAHRLQVVGLLKESSQRDTVPLEYEARRRMMRQDRDILDEADAIDESGGDSEEGGETKKEDGDPKEDLVLSEAFNILADMVRLTGGEEAPPPSVRQRQIPAWLRALGGDR